MELTLRLSHRSTLISSTLNLLSRSLSPLSPSRTGRLFLVESHFLFVGKQQQPKTTTTATTTTTEKPTTTTTATTTTARFLASVSLLVSCLNFIKFHSKNFVQSLFLSSSDLAKTCKLVNLQLKYLCRLFYQTSSKVLLNNRRRNFKEMLAADSNE